MAYRRSRIGKGGFDLNVEVSVGERESAPGSRHIRRCGIRVGYSSRHAMVR